MRIISKVSLDAHTSVLFKEQEILQFLDIYLYQARYILIIQEIPVFFIDFIVDLILENSQFGFKVLRFSTR